MPETSQATPPAAAATPEGAPPVTPVPDAPAVRPPVKSGGMGSRLAGRWVVNTLFTLVIVGGGVGLGLLLQKRFLAQQAQRGGQATVNVSRVPERILSDDLAVALGRAQQEIVIYAGKGLSSRKVLDALCNQAKAGKRVIVFLSSAHARKVTDKLPAYLKAGGIKEIYVDPKPANEQFAVLDGVILIQSELAWAAHKKGTEGYTFFVRDEALAQDYVQRLRQAVLRCDRIL